MATQFQVELLQQALGLNYDVSPYRNLFCAAARSDLDRQWNALCLEGLALSCGGRLEHDGYNYYRASERGIEIAKDNKREQQSDGRRVPPEVPSAEAGQSGQPAEGPEGSAD